MQVDIKDQKIILDVDTGVDDALAILLLEKFISKQILGICTCGGNVSVEETSQNTLSVLSLLNSRTPVYKGSAKNSMNQDFHFARDYHGVNGLCGLRYETDQKISDQSAVDFIIDSANKYAGELTLILLAPLTNLALALENKPEIAKKINQVVIMGGAINVPGNETSFAEFNFYQDPQAVDIVLNNIERIFIVPLDVTGKCLVKENDINKDVDDKSNVSQFVNSLVQSWYLGFGHSKNRYFELYDPLAVSVVLGDFLKFKREKVYIHTDMAKFGGLSVGVGKEIFYAKKVNEKNFMKFFYDAILGF